MTLYELQDEYKALLELAEDPDVDEEVLSDTMAALDGEIEVKADNYAKIIKQLEANAAAIKDEESRLHWRRQTIENHIRRMKANLEVTMIATGKTKFKTDLFSFGIQKNPPSVVMDEQYIENIPAEYLIEQEPKVDKAKIKEEFTCILSERNPNGKHLSENERDHAGDHSGRKEPECGGRKELL